MAWWYFDEKWHRLADLVSWNYEKFIVHYAELAEKNKIEIFCVGTELHKTIYKEKEWRSVIAKVKSVYKGKLTYAANFHEEYQQIKFWDALDYIGVQAYFSLTQSENHSLEELQKRLGSAYYRHWTDSKEIQKTCIVHWDWLSKR